MPHVDQRTLDALLSHQLSSEQVSRVKQHVRGCQTCSRQLEEWRDLFDEVESIIPTHEHPARRPDGPVLVPSPGFGLSRRLDYTRWLLPAGIVLALGVGYLVSRSGRSPTGLETVSMDPTPTASASPITAPAPAPPEAPRPVAPDPAPPRIEKPAPATRQSPRPVTAPATAPAFRPASDSSRAAPSSTTPHFSRVEMEHAIRMLAGSIRMIDGLEPDHVEAGPGETVPGARIGLEVVRVVYALPGGRLLLDQQRLEAQGEPAPGDTLLGTGSDGVSLARWVDGRFWLALAGRMSQDSLRQLVRRVR